MLSREQELDLTGMAYHWGTAYDVSMSDGVWRAIPHAEPDAILTADSADGLRSPRVRPASPPHQILS